MRRASKPPAPASDQESEGRAGEEEEETAGVGVGRGPEEGKMMKRAAGARLIFVFWAKSGEATGSGRDVERGNDEQDGPRWRGKRSERHRGEEWSTEREELKGDLCQRREREGSLAEVREVRAGK